MPDTFKTNLNTQIAHLRKLIGNTPFIAVSYRYKGGAEQQVLVKCEQYNMTGSIKDRLALYIIEKAIVQGKLKPADLIVTAAAGHTGISFAAIGKAFGNRVRVIVPDAMSLEARAIIKTHGAELRLVSRDEGGFAGCVQLAESMGHYDDVFLTRQPEHLYRAEVHEQTTGREIGYSLILEKLKPAGFLAGAGTGGTLAGISKFLRTIFPDIRVHPLQPAENQDTHRIQGINYELLPAAGLSGLDEAVKVSDGEAILTAQKIRNELSMPVGISSGANLAGAIRLQQQLGAGKLVVTIFPDDHKKYLGTDLFKAEPGREDYLVQDIQFTGQRVLTRV